MADPANPDPTQVNTPLRVVYFIEAVTYSIVFLITVFR